MNTLFSREPFNKHLQSTPQPERSWAQTPSAELFPLLIILSSLTEHFTTLKWDTSCSLYRFWWVTLRSHTPQQFVSEQVDFTHLLAMGYSGHCWPLIATGLSSFPFPTFTASCNFLPSETFPLLQHSLPAPWVPCDWCFSRWFYHFLSACTAY